MSSTVNQAIAASVAKFLSANRFSQVSVARALEIDPASLSKKLAGTRDWRLREADALLRFLTRELGRPVEYAEVFGDPLAAETQHPTTAVA